MYSQTKFLRDYVVKEAGHGNLLPLTYLLISGQVMGEGVNQVKGFITGRKQSANMWKRALDNMAVVGTLGMFEKVISTARYQSPPAGPTISTIWDIVTGGVQAAKGNVAPIIETGLKAVPAVGGRLKKEFREATETKSTKTAREREERYWEKHPLSPYGIMGKPPAKTKKTLRGLRQLKRLY
jgi:hypothetical protein